MNPINQINPLSSTEKTTLIFALENLLADYRRRWRAGKKLMPSQVLAGKTALALVAKLKKAG